MVDILEAARYLVFLSYQEDRHSLTPVKLQKILYLCGIAKRFFLKISAHGSMVRRMKKYTKHSKNMAVQKFLLLKEFRVLLTKMQGIHWKRCGMNTENEQRMILWI